MSDQELPALGKHQNLLAVNLACSSWMGIEGKQMIKWIHMVLHDTDYFKRVSFEMIILDQPQLC